MIDLGRATENHHFLDDQSQKLEQVKNHLAAKFQEEQFKIKTIEEIAKLEIQDCEAGYKQ
ncbi:MAG: hypothetical protein LBS28_04930 [Streptococcaceae bacterium]|nr:hypothetical protein [Streptococcaceae bacterium]